MATKPASNSIKRLGSLDDALEYYGISRYLALKLIREGNLPGVVAYGDVFRFDVEFADRVRAEKLEKALAHVA